jgi:hypothetical protein
MISWDFLGFPGMSEYRWAKNLGAEADICFKSPFDFPLSGA